jgi:hypothetical protein
MEEAPSKQAIIGRYILTPAIFDVLEKTTPGAGGELQLTDAMRNLLAFLNVLQAQAAEIIDFIEIEWRYEQFAVVVADRGLMAMHVAQAVERDVGAQRLIENSLRLEGVYHAVLAGQASQGHGMRPQTRAGFDHGRPRADELTENLALRFRQLTQLGERLAGIGIVPRIDQQAVPRAGQAVEPAGGNAILRRLLGLQLGMFRS